MRYAGLEAFDATGRRLTASLELERGSRGGASGGRVLIRVRDAGARYPVRIDPLFQLGPKLTTPDNIGAAAAGFSVALSGDGNTAVIGGPDDNNSVGAAWIFVRSGASWTEQHKLVPTGAVGQAHFGFSVALSSDGSTALIGAANDGGPGAVYVFVRTGISWAQQARLTGTGEMGNGSLGYSVALSASGDVAVVGAPNDSSNAGAVWTLGRSGASWSQFGSKLTPTGEVGAGWFGSSVALSGLGNTALVGATNDNSGVGAAWAFTLTSTSWVQGQELKATGEVGAANFGDWVALSSDASTALVAGFSDDSAIGAVWAYAAEAAGFTQTAKLVPSDESGAARFGIRAAVSSDGTVAVIGGALDGNNAGAAWIFTRTGSSWTQDGAKLTGRGEVGGACFGFSVGLSDDGSTALIGGPDDNGDDGAAWIFGHAPPACANVGATTAVGGGTTTLALQCAGPVGAPLSYAIVKGPAHGSLGPINQGTGAVSYTPAPGYAGTDQFTYAAADTDGSSNVATATITIPRATLRLNPTIGYTFHAYRSGTFFSALYLTGVPRGAQIHVACRGARCPFRSRVERVPGRVVCTGRGRRRQCRHEPPPRVGTVTLTGLLRHRRLTVGTRITIDAVQAGAIGKAYRLTIRARRPPGLKVGCLAPGSMTPGRGC